MSARPVAWSSATVRWNRFGHIDTLVVSGGSDMDDAAATPTGDNCAPRGALPPGASVCSGAFLLAAAGLLDGRRATYPLGRMRDLDRDYPTVSVDPDAIYIRTATSGPPPASPPASTSLSPWSPRTTAARLLRWSPADLSSTCAVPVGKPNSPVLAAQSANTEPIHDLLEWLPEHLSPDLDPGDGNTHHPSERHFSRLFKSEVGVSPAEHWKRPHGIGLPTLENHLPIEDSPRLRFRRRRDHEPSLPSKARHNTDAAPPPLQPDGRGFPHRPNRRPSLTRWRPRTGDDMPRMDSPNQGPPANVRSGSRRVRQVACRLGFRTHDIRSCPRVALTGNACWGATGI